MGIVTVVRETQLAQKSLPNNVINKLKQLVYVCNIYSDIYDTNRGNTTRNVNRYQRRGSEGIVTLWCN